MNNLNVSIVKDVMFKMFFKSNKERLAFIINNILDLGICADDIEFANNEILPTFDDGKNSVLDLKVKLSNDDIVFVEMQSVREKSLTKRMEYYTSKVMVEQLESGMLYKEIKKVYGIFFLNYNDLEYPNLFTKLVDYDIINDKKSHGYREKNIVNLTKLGTSNIFSDDMIEFLKFMTLKDESEMEKMTRTRKELEDAYNTVKKLTNDPVIREYIWVKDKEEMDKTVQLDDALTEGREIGIAQGIEQGKISMVEKLYLKGMSNSDIAEITELSIDRVNELVNNYN